MLITRVVALPLLLVGALKFELEKKWKTQKGYQLEYWVICIYSGNGCTGSRAYCNNVVKKTNENFL